jgi:hypothetical protein
MQQMRALLHSLQIANLAHANAKRTDGGTVYRRTVRFASPKQALSACDRILVVQKAATDLPLM